MLKKKTKETKTKETNGLVILPPNPPKNTIVKV